MDEVCEKVMTSSIKIVEMAYPYCINGVQGIRRLSYQFCRSDAGCSESRRPRQNNDCTVRALALTGRITYDEAYDMLKKAGRQCSRGFHIQKWLNKQPWAWKISFPAVKGEFRMNPGEFCQLYPQGRYICKVAKHVFAVIDGVVFDASEVRADRCIYVAWQIV